MIILRQRVYSAKEKIAEFILGKADQAIVGASRKSREKGSKIIAKSLDKGRLKKEVQRIREKYKSDPKKAKEEISKFLKQSKEGKRERLRQLEEEARRRLEVISPSKVAQTKEQIAETAKYITNPNIQMAEKAINNTKNGIISGGKSVLSGVKQAYSGTGNMLTRIGKLVVGNPTTAVGQPLGTAVNVIGTAHGQYWVNSVPVGTVVDATGRVLMPRSWARKLRQKAIKLEKAAKESGFNDWSVRKELKHIVRPQASADGWTIRGSLRNRVNNLVRQRSKPYVQYGGKLSYI